MSWRALPEVRYGLVMHEFEPNLEVESSQISLERGSAVYCFEIYSSGFGNVKGDSNRVQSSNSSKGDWYRGYSLNSNQHSVVVGIFPVNCICLMGEYTGMEEETTPTNKNERWSGSGTSARMESVKELEEDEGSVQPTVASITTSSPRQVQDSRPAPPIPSLRYGDGTSTAGNAEVIVDEISAALKEWSTLLFLHLENQNYSKFHSIKAHIDALHAGRRNLLMSHDSTYSLSMDERNKLVTEMVEKLSSGNIEQDLEIIVRSPHSGGLADVNTEGEIDRPSWMSAVRMYTHQVALAHGSKSIESFDGGLPPRAAQKISFVVHSPTLSQLPPLEISASPKGATFYHVLIELRAFLSPMVSAEGETTELCFSLFSKNESKFISQEYIVYLDSHNKPLSDLDHIKTLFTDLSLKDLQDELHLVCRIIKNGSSGIGSRDTLISPSLNGRQSQTSSFVSETGVDFGLGTSSGMLRMDKQGRQSVRRPFGAAVLLLPRFNKDSIQSDELELNMPIFIPLNDNFATLPEAIITSQISQFSPPSRPGRLLMNVKIFQSDLAAIKLNPIVSNVEDTGRLSFPDVVFPNLVLNNLFLTLLNGEFASKNVEVALEVRTKEGALVEGALSRSKVTQYNSIVLSSRQPVFGEIINIEIPVEMMSSCHIFFSFRARVLARDDKPFAFAYLPLFDAKVFLPDDSHCLALYKYDRSCAVPEVYFQAPSTTSNKSVPLATSLSKVLIPLKDFLIIKSCLISTKFTQNGPLLRFLNAEGLTMTELKEVLTNLRFVDSVEICKFVRDIFDTLFSLLISAQNSNGELEDLIFSNLVNILNIFGDRRFTNFKPVVDAYINTHLTSSAACSHILKGLQRLLKESVEKGPILRSAIKNWHYLLKFSLRSRQIQRAKDVGSAVTSHLETNFKKDLSSLLAQINTLMRNLSPAIIGTQTLAVQHFSELLEDLASCYSNLELIDIAVAFVDSISATKGKIVISSIVLQNELVQFFHDSKGRNALVPNIIRWSKVSLGKFDELNSCSPKDSPTIRDGVRVAWIERIRLQVGVIAVILDQLHAAMIDLVVQKDRTLMENEQDNLEYLLNLLPYLLESYRELQNSATMNAVLRQRSQLMTTSNFPISFPSTYPFTLLSSIKDGEPSLQNSLGDVAAVVIVLLHLAPPKITVNYLETTLAIGKEKCARLLSSLFQVCKSILENDAFPSTWLNINILAHQAFINLIDYSETLLIREFIPETLTEFDLGLWNSLFSMLLFTISSPQLTIEEFSPQKRRAVWKLTGNLRGFGARIILKLWNKMGAAQVEFTGLSGDIVRLALSPHDELRGSAIEILCTMIINEYDSNGSFLSIEAEVIDRLDKVFMAETKGDEISRSLFVEQLRVLFETATIDATLTVQVDAFLKRIQEFLELLLAVTNLPEGDEYQEDRIMSTLKLMSFIRGIGKSEIYIRYVNRLVTYHVEIGNSIQAGMTLKLMSDLYDWSNEPVEALMDLSFPQQTSYNRKESLYMRILDHLARGGAFETAIALTKELQQEYEIRFDYGKLAALLTLQSSFYSRILTTSDRDNGEYFRVAYYGLGFPPTLTGKQFIYHSPTKNPNFIQNFLEKHPQSQLFTSHDLPPDSIQFEEGRWIQITSVKPIPEEGQVDRPSILDSMRSNDADGRILDWYLHMETSRFTFERIVKKEIPEEEGLNAVENEFLSNWTERTTLISENRFPSILLRSEILEIRLLSISPLSTSVTTLYSQLTSLQALEKRYLTLTEQGISRNLIDTNPLSLRLNLELDRPANEDGILLWRNVFLREGKESGTLLKRLAEGIDEFVITLQRCLKLHSILCPVEMRGFQETLESFLEQNFSDEVTRLPVQLERPCFSQYKIMESNGVEDPFRNSSFELANPQQISPLPYRPSSSTNTFNGTGATHTAVNGAGLKRGNSIFSLLNKSSTGSISKKSSMLSKFTRRVGSIESSVEEE